MPMRLRHNAAKLTGQRGGMVVGTITTLLLVILSFTLGYIIGKGRRSQAPVSEAPASIEEILRRELSKTPPSAPAPADPDAGGDPDTRKPDLKLLNKITAPKAPYYTVQLGAFKEAGQAQRLQVDLQKKGVQSEVQKIELSDKGVWWRVQSGRFDDLDGAKKRGNEIRKKSTVAYIIKKLDS